MKLLIDVNLSPQWVGFLIDHRHEGVHWSSVGLISAPDRQIMDDAAAHGYVVFTHGLDFGALLALRKAHGPSVVQVRTEDVLPQTIGEVVLRALTVARSYLESGALVTIDVNRSRIPAASDLIRRYPAPGTAVSSPPPG